MGAQHFAFSLGIGRQIEGIMLLAGGMLLGDVERGEIIVIGFDVRAFCNGKTHLSENCDNLLNGARQRMQACFSLRAGGQCHVNRLSCQPVIECGVTKKCLSQFNGSGDAILQPIQLLPSLLSGLRVHAAQLAHHQ